jgi:hypothetical protein
VEEVALPREIHGDPALFRERNYILVPHRTTRLNNRSDTRVEKYL